MPYKYYTSGSPPYMGSPNTTMIDDFQALLTQQFAIATDYFVIQEESTIGSGTLSNIGVRITGAISATTSEKLGDDFKNILFNNITYSTKVGKKYYFDSNYWITIFTESIKNLAASCTVRRCNNLLRWVDENGVYFEEPCAIDYKISRPKDQMGTVDPVTPEGYTDIFVQLNDKTKLIRPNQRFLFGNTSRWVCFKVFGNGIKNFLNQKTSDNDSAQILTLSVGGDEITTNDNLTLGIADYYKYYASLNSGSTIIPYIQVSPNQSYILQSGSVAYTVNYYSGSVATTGSFVFSISGSNVPTDHYDFVVNGTNTFTITNYEKYLEDTLNIACSGSSGSKVLNLQLRGEW